MEHLMQRGVQVAILGTGDKDHEDAFRYFDAKYSDQMLRTTSPLTTRSRTSMYAGADMLLMPSRFEPCGLSQMIAMRYGALPIVRETGGLRDSVVPYNQYTGEGTGFSFANMNADEMADTLLGACRDLLESIQRLGISFSCRPWTPTSAGVARPTTYMDIYHDLHPEIIRYNKRRDR